MPDELRNKDEAIVMGKQAMLYMQDARDIGLCDGQSISAAHVTAEVDHVATHLRSPANNTSRECQVASAHTRVTFQAALVSYQRQSSSRTADHCRARRGI